MMSSWRCDKARFILLAATCAACLGPFNLVRQANSSSPVSPPPPTNCTTPTQRFDVNSSPQGVATDGTDLWVAHFDGTVLRVRASDGVHLGTWTGGRQPSGVAILNGKVYVTSDIVAGQLYVIDPNQPPGPLQVFATGLGGEPVRITTDGSSLWTANSQGSVSKIDPATGQVTNFKKGFTSPSGIVFDGSSIWVSDSGDHSIKRLDSVGAVATSIKVGLEPGNPAFDGTNLWVPDFGGVLTVIRAATGEVLMSTPLTVQAMSAASDGQYVVLAGESLSLWRVADFAHLGTFPPIASVQTNPLDVCFDGVSFWATLQLANQLARFCVQAALTCSYQLTPSGADHGPGAESGQVSVTTPDGCGWTATSNTPWITITSGQTGVSSGTITYQLTANSSTAPRDGGFFLNGTFFMIHQAAAGCSFQLQPTSRTHGPDQESGTVKVTDPKLCGWEPFSNATWIKVPQGSGTAGAGSFTYQIDPNPGQSSRTGTISVSGQTFTITQTGTGCSYSLSSNQVTLDSVGGSGSFNVLAPDGCGWSASSNAPWLTITSSMDGSGNGVVGYSAAPNFFGNSRSAMIQVASATFAVNQQGTTCAYLLMPVEQQVSSDGGPGTLTLTTPASCPWIASSFDDWISFPGATSGLGQATISYVVAPNPSQTGRNGTINVASGSMGIFQEGRLKITGVAVQGKNLIVTGGGFTDISDIIIDDVPQRTLNDPDNPTTVLIGKKSANHIASGQMVMVQVLDHRSGITTAPFPFTKP